MAVVTPGDILRRCEALDGRIAAADKVIREAPESHLDGPFRSAWMERQRRWESVRNMCGDYASRMWNFKWGPILDDWEKNQAAWEAKVQVRTGIVIPVGRPLSRASDETVLSTIDQALRFPEVGGTIKAVAVALGVAVAGAVTFVALRRR